MSVAPRGLGLTADEQRERDQEDYDLLWLEDGKAYRVETSRIWDRTTEYGRRVHSWHVTIWQDFSPWGIVALQSGFKTKWGAEKWGRDYIKRGGPPSDYWMLNPPKPNPNVMVYRRQDG
jgi:hypothetical protein